jgi:hypothetical protein
MIGSTVGPYQILAKIGEGGRSDTRLKRDVAIKVRPDLFAGDPERLARFEREAYVLAALNHPNIAQVYGVELGAADAGVPSRARLAPIANRWHDAMGLDVRRRPRAIHHPLPRHGTDAAHPSSAEGTGRA